MAEPEETRETPEETPAQNAHATASDPDETLAGETSELPGAEEPHTERRPPVDATSPRPLGSDPQRLRDATRPLGGYLRARAAQLRDLLGRHRLASALVALVAVAAAAAILLAASQGQGLPSTELVSSDAADRLDVPTYSPGLFGPEDLLVTRDVEVRSVEAAPGGQATAEVMVAYSGSAGVSAEKAATLRYERAGGTWTLVGDPEDVRVSWKTTSGVDERRVVENIAAVLERAESSLPEGDPGSPTLAELYEGSQVTIDENSFDAEEGRDALQITCARTSAYEEYVCRLSVTFVFRSSSGQWEIEGASVTDGGKERSLQPLAGAWAGSFQAQETDGKKCLAARDAGLTVEISSVRSDAGLEQVSGTISGVAHFHANPSSDSASCEGDTPLDGVAFTATLVEEGEGALVFEGTLPEDVGGTISVQLTFGSAEDPSRATARVTTTYDHTGSFLFFPYDETFTYTDLFTLSRGSTEG